MTKLLVTDVNGTPMTDARVVGIMLSDRDKHIHDLRQTLGFSLMCIDYIKKTKLTRDQRADDMIEDLTEMITDLLGDRYDTLG